MASVNRLTKTSKPDPDRAIVLKPPLSTITYTVVFSKQLAEVALSAITVLKVYRCKHVKMAVCSSSLLMSEAGRAAAANGLVKVLAEKRLVIRGSF